MLGFGRDSPAELPNPTERETSEIPVDTHASDGHDLDGFLGSPVPSAVLRESFHFVLIAACQRFICRVSCNDMSWRDALRELVESVDPKSPFEDRVFRDELARLALGASHDRRSSNATSIREVFRAIEFIVACPSSSTKDAFRQWNSQSQTGRPHVDPGRLYALVQGAGADKPRLATIAHEAGRTARTIRKQFREAHGMSPRECRARALALRIVEALRSSDLKVTSVAFELGIKSPKNLYLAVKAHSGLTPSQVRRLPPEAFGALCERIRTGRAVLKPDLERGHDVGCYAG